jgi:hypothetical protein
VQTKREDLYILVGVIVGFILGIAFAEYHNSHSGDVFSGGGSISGGGEFFIGVVVALVGGLVGWLIAKLTDDR